MKPYVAACDHFRSRDSQTRIKHEILHAYGGGWSGIIGTGWGHNMQLRGSVQDLVYVDGFAGEGRYERDADAADPSATPIWGSPMIGLRVIESAARTHSGSVNVQVTAVVVEKDDPPFSRLRDNLIAAGLQTPIHIAASGDALRWRHINLIREDFRKVVPGLINWLKPQAQVLAFIDPYGTGMPMSALAPLVGRPKTDCIVLFPWMDINRKGGSACKRPEDMTPEDRGNVTRVTEVFGTPDALATLCDPALPAERKELILADLYFGQLRALDDSLAVKNIPLRLSQAQSRVVYHLFLTTRNGDGALKMNEVLRGASLREVFALWADEMERQRAVEAASEQDSLFGGIAMDAMRAEPTAQRQAADESEVQRTILRRVPTGTSTTWADLKKQLANEIYTEGEIKKALTQLRRQGLVLGQSPRSNKDVIKFAARKP